MFNMSYVSLLQRPVLAMNNLIGHALGKQTIGFPGRRSGWHLGQAC